MTKTNVRDTWLSASSGNSNSFACTIQESALRGFATAHDKTWVESDLKFARYPLDCRILSPNFKALNVKPMFTKERFLE